MTDLDAFRGLTELQERGRLGYALRVGVRSDETPLGAARKRPTRSSTAPTACADCCAPCCSEVRFGDFLKATVLLSAASATLLAALTVIGLCELAQRHRRLRLLRRGGRWRR